MSTTTNLRLTPKIRKMRVAIAKDVLAQLDAKRIKATQGIYIDGEFRKGANIATDGDLSDLLPLVKKGCQVCALGACLISKAKLYDAVPAADFASESWMNYPAILGGHRYEIVEQLEGIFDKRSLDDMERAFEADEDCVRTEVRKFGLRHKTPAARLRAIMTNIIDHNGEFRPDL